MSWRLTFSATSDTFSVAVLREIADAWKARDEDAAAGRVEAARAVRSIDMVAAEMVESNEAVTI